jgi:hypothetical protein
MEEVGRDFAKHVFDVILIRVPFVTEETIKILGRIHTRFPRIPLITIAPAADPGIRYMARGIENHRFVDEPLEISDLAKLIEALRGGSTPSDGSAARLHPRAPRKGKVELVDSQTGERIAAEFIDFAQMGARILLLSKKSLGASRHWQLHYPSTSEPGKIHRLESKVIWEIPEQATGLASLVSWPRVMIGVRFIASL